MSRGRKRPLPAHIKVPRFYRARPIACIAIVILAGLTFVGRQARRSDTRSTPATDYLKYHDKTFIVEHVVDGDTMDLDVPDGRYPRTRVRLWGVDTPEVAGSPRGAMHWGAEASAFAKRTLLGAEVHVELIPDRGHDIWRGWFESKPMLRFVIQAALGR